MSEPITIQKLIEASMDSDSLEVLVNGDENTQVTTRTGETYPSVKKALKTMFENGGLPATPFATKALMTASALADGSFAIVTKDNDNNGMYEKVSGSWVVSQFDPYSRIIEYLNGLAEFADIEDLTVFADVNFENNIVDNAEIINGVYVDTTALEAKTASNVQMVTFPVKSGDYYVFNRNPNLSQQVMFVGHNRKIVSGETGLIKFGASQKIGNNYVIKIPEGVTWGGFNTKIPSLDYDAFVDKPDQPIVKASKFSGELVKYSGSNIADTFARSQLSAAIKKSSIDYGSDLAVQEYTTHSGLYIEPVEAIIKQTGTAILTELNLTEGKTYSVYYGDSYHDGINKRGGAIGARADNNINTEPNVSGSPSEIEPVTAYDTANPNIKTFTVPEGKPYIYIGIKLISSLFDYDVTKTFAIAEGKGDPRPYINSIDGHLLRDIKTSEQVAQIMESGAVSVLKGKKIAAIGDSITADSFRANRGWLLQLSDRVGGIDTYNYGISDTGFYDRQDVVSTMADIDFDYIVLNLGSNDGNNTTKGLELGVWKDSDPNTLNGSMHKIITELKDKYPLSKLVIFTPIPRVGHLGDNPKEHHGYTMLDIADLLIKYANHYSIPHLDMTRNSGLDPSNPVQNETYFKAPSRNEGDGIHPNDAGFSRMVDRFKPFLESV